MKAIIVAAGMGRRLKGLAGGRPKCLLEINGVSILERQLRAYRAAGINDISIVTGYEASRLAEVPGVKLYHNDNFENNNVLLSLMHASPELESDVIISYGDIVFGEALVRQVLPVKNDFSVVADKTWRNNYIGRTEHPESEAEKITAASGRVLAIGKHLSSQSGEAEFIGMFTLSKNGCEIWKSVFEEVQIDYAGLPFQGAHVFEHSYITDFFQELISRRTNVSVSFTSEDWTEIDTEQDYNRACFKFSDLDLGEKWAK